MFVHWGLYSVHGRDVWSMFNEQTPVDEYRTLADEFAPDEFDANDWAATAKAAGANYMVMCSRQHDGYSLFDSAVSDFTSAKTAAARDFVAEYAAAARSHGLKVGLYYSLLDWRYPAYFSGPTRDPDGWRALREYIHAQIAELCTHYGQIDVLWYDGAWPYKPEDWGAHELNAAARELQPGILINNRSGLPEDFDTPEQYIPVVPPRRLWEVCMTMNDHWGHCPGDSNWKATGTLVNNLVRCASGNGNYLLNVGPDREGVIPPEAIARLNDMGAWLGRNGESVYGTEDARALRRIISSWELSNVGMVHTFPTVRENTLYTHVLRWPGTELAIGNLASSVLRAHFLAGGSDIDFRQDGSRVVLSGLPRYAPDSLDTVIALECDGPPRCVDRFAPEDERM